MSNRDWHSYNEALVRRGELDLDSSVLEEWRKRELKKANDGKVGKEPYQSLPGVVHQAPHLRQASLPPTSPTGRRRVSYTSSLGS
jgi:hypothetical protein